MKHTDSAILASIDEWVIKMVVDEYGLSPQDAMDAFLTSETHALLEDYELRFWWYSPKVIFDIYKSERELGSPLESSYLMEGI
jgi:hypothetical protein